MECKENLPDRENSVAQRGKVQRVKHVCQNRECRINSNAMQSHRNDIEK